VSEPETASVMDGWLDPPRGGRRPGVVNWTLGVDYLTDASSFESAADALVAGWQRRTDDGLLKPILYLYRHAAELHLKAAIKVANMCVAEPYQDIDRWLRTPGQGGHSLVALRDRLLDMLSRPELDAGDPPLGEESLDGRLLLELHELDPRGDEFRYPSRWDSNAKATIATGMPGGSDTVGKSVLIDVERMGADLSSLNGHLG